jgi:hypothetical protein
MYIKVVGVCKYNVVHPLFSTLQVAEIKVNDEGYMKCPECGA